MTFFALFAVGVFMFALLIFKATRFNFAWKLARDQRACMIKIVTNVQLGGHPNAGINWESPILKSFWDVTFQSHHQEITRGRDPMLLYHPKIQDLIHVYAEDPEYAILKPTQKMVSVSEKKRKTQKEVLF